MPRQMIMTMERERWRLCEWDTVPKADCIHLFTGCVKIVTLIPFACSYFGNANGGQNHGGAGTGPWIMADMENALFGADNTSSNEPPINHNFVMAMVKGDTGGKPGHWAIKGGDATVGDLKVYFDGKRAPGYSPMRKQGAIVLGVSASAPLHFVPSRC